MSKVTFSQQATNQVEEKFVWILTAKEKKSKRVVNFICKDGPATDEVVSQLKDRNLTFITLTTDKRVISYMKKEPVKAWKSNENALRRRGLVPEEVYKPVFDYLDCTTEEERWSVGSTPVNYREIIESDIPGEPGEDFEPTKYDED